ncbi:CvpA family protein [Rhodopirellula sp. MGV]|uniref:CvpA family protein n=1 Tax=Rhodopirellula sp. MGV TaxID=2023130 RepID=UPI00130468C5|nr:CvpA family protein [Rhodopirellula sp. MGV]
MIAIVLATMVASAVLFRQGDPIAAISLVLISFSSMVAFKMGVIGIASSLIGLTAAFYFAPAAAPTLEPYATRYFETTGLANRFLSIAVAGVLISMIVSLLVTALLGGTIAHRQRLAKANHYGGFVLGAIEGTLLVWLALGGLISMQLWQRDANKSENAVAQWVDHWAAQTRQSAIGPFVRDYNPFERIEPLAETQKLPAAVRQLSSPGAVDRLLADPEIRSLRNDPEVSRAIEELRGEPQLAGVFRGGQPLGQEELLFLMNSPAVMKLADDPEFRQGVRRVLETHANTHRVDR